MQELRRDRDGNGRRRLARDAGHADRAGQPGERRLRDSRVAEPFEEARPLGLGANQPGEAERLPASSAWQMSWSIACE